MVFSNLAVNSTDSQVKRLLGIFKSRCRSFGCEGLHSSREVGVEIGDEISYRVSHDSNLYCLFEVLQAVRVC
jgi:hypothetical protein